MYPLRHEFGTMIRSEASLETQFLKALACYQNDPARDQQEIAKLVARIPPDCQDAALLPGLLFCLKSGDAVLEKSGSLGIMRLGALAQPAVPDLLRIANRDDGDASFLAVAALGAVPGNESVEAIVEVMHSWRKWDRIFGIALPAFHAHGIHTEPFLDEVHRHLNAICPEQLQIHDMVLNSLRDTIRLNRTEALSALSLPVVADLDEVRQFSDGGVRWSLSQDGSDIPDISEGMVRFRYQLCGKNSEVGVTCERLAGQSDRVVVTILVDDQWYGASPMVGLQYLATALRESYDLEPEKTFWVIHQSASSAFTRKGQDEFWLLDLAYDPISGHYSGPQRTLYPSMEAVLSALEGGGSRAYPNRSE